MLLKVGTRGSKLSLVQTDQFVAKLRQVQPDVEVKKTIITTKGDRDRVTPIYFLGEKGIFEKEINDAVLDGRVDFAVHSLKDLPVFNTDTGLVLAALPERESSLDALVSRGDESLQELAAGSVVGTSSLLRVTQLRRVRPDLNPQPIRGNVETRIRKVDSGEFDAVILAEAGLQRLDMLDRVSEWLPVNDFMPAPGQGIVAVVARQNDSRITKILKSVDHPTTRIEAEAERELVRILEGGCKVPIGALASVSGSLLSIMACILSLDGREKLQVKKEGDVNQALTLAREAAEDLLAKGAKKLEESWRQLYA